MPVQVPLSIVNLSVNRTFSKAPETIDLTPTTSASAAAGHTPKAILQTVSVLQIFLLNGF